MNIYICVYVYVCLYVNVFIHSVREQEDCLRQLMAQQEQLHLALQAEEERYKQLTERAEKELNIGIKELIETGGEEDS